MASAVVLSGSESLAFLTSQVAQYIGGDTRLGRRVRVAAAVAMFALALRAIGAVGGHLSRGETGFRVILERWGGLLRTTLTSTMSSLLEEVFFFFVTRRGTRMCFYDLR